MFGNEENLKKVANCFADNLKNVFEKKEEPVILKKNEKNEQKPVVV
jgi:hypothetical protein